MNDKIAILAFDDCASQTDFSAAGAGTMFVWRWHRLKKGVEHEVSEISLLNCTFCFFAGGGASGVPSLFSAFPLASTAATFFGAAWSGLGGPLMSPYFLQKIPHVSHITKDERPLGPFHQTVASLVLHELQNSFPLPSASPLMTEPSSSGSLLDRTETVRRNLVGAGAVGAPGAARNLRFSSPSRSLCTQSDLRKSR